jgi:hypothetical protein
MAKEVHCACGRTFNVPDDAQSSQGRRCGRTWHPVGAIGAIAAVAFGGEIARSDRYRGDRKRSSEHRSTGHLTNRLPKNKSTIASVISKSIG